MPIVNLQTNLKSLKFSKDLEGGNKNSQPYITTPIPANGEEMPTQDLGLSTPDFLNRGGLNALRDTQKDLTRLGKFFIDTSSPSGLSFTAKQQLLSRISVATQASGNQSSPNKWKNSALNNGVYNPLSTLIQAGIVTIGGHIQKQGIIPIKGIRTYGDVVKGDGVLSNSIVEIKNNRLVNLYNTQYANLSNDFSIEDQVNIYSYSGGPNSILGIGKTNIRFATDNRGAYFPTGAIVKNYQAGPLKRNQFSLTSPPLGVSNAFYNLTEDLNSLPSLSVDGGITYEPDSFSAFNKGTLASSNNTKQLGIGEYNELNHTTLTLEETYNRAQYNKETRLGYFNDFKTDIEAFKRTVKLKDGDPKKSSTIMSISPSYAVGFNSTIEGLTNSRINQQSPGQRGNILNYTKGKIVGYGTNDSRTVVVDQINAQPIYKSGSVRTGITEGKKGTISKNDLVKFRIAAIDTENPSQKQFIHFRAFIDSFSDNYNASWTSQKYMGRGEQFYKYDNFTRDINMSFTVIAQSKPEIMEMYRKLNFLASNLAPDYTDSGYMAGPLVQLTMGAWCYELPGFLNSITLDIPQESTWEIGINEFGKSDASVKEMPHMVKVSGISFTPIHTFRPSKQSIKGEDYGAERYIALTQGSNNNYDTKRKKGEKYADFVKRANPIKPNKTDSVDPGAGANLIKIKTEPPTLRTIQTNETKVEEELDLGQDQFFGI